MKRHSRYTTIGVALAAAVILVPLAYAADNQSQATSATTEVTVTSANAAQYIAESSTRPVLMDFSTSWCQYCKVLNPILKAEAAKAGGKWLLAHIDGDQEKQGLNAKFNVTAYPTVIVLSKGAEVEGTRLKKWPGTESAVKTWLNLSLKAASATSKLPAGKKPSGSKPTTPPSTPAPAPGGSDPTWEGLPKPLTTGKFVGAIDVTSKNHAQFMEASKKRLVLIDFSKEGCMPCENLAPHLRAKNAKDKKWVWGVLDGTIHQDLWVKYGNPWFPTMLAFRDGKEVARHVGYEGNFAEVDEWINKLVAGQVPPSAETVMNLSSAESFERAVKLSKGKTIGVRFTAQADDDMHNTLVEKANADKGKWVFASVDATSPYGKQLAPALNVKLDSIATDKSIVVVLYEGRTWQMLVPNLVGVKDKAAIEAFVKTMTTTFYKPGTPSDGPGTPPGNGPGTPPGDAPGTPPGNGPGGAGGAGGGDTQRPAPGLPGPGGQFPMPPSQPPSPAPGGPAPGPGGFLGKLLSFPMMLLKLFGLGM